MNSEDIKPTLNPAAILQSRVQGKLKDLLTSMKPGIAAMFTAKNYFAVESGVITGAASDFGVVRYSAQFHKRVELNPQWNKIKDLDNVSDFAKYFEREAYVQVSINMASLGQLRVTAPVVKDGRFVLTQIQYDTEAGLGTLTHEDVLKVIDLVKAEGLLTAPQYVEVLPQ